MIVAAKYFPEIVGLELFLLMIEHFIDTDVKIIVLFNV
jgi:hypothetical protein